MLKQLHDERIARQASKISTPNSKRRQYVYATRTNRDHKSVKLDHRESKERRVRASRKFRRLIDLSLDDQSFENRDRNEDYLKHDEASNSKRGLELETKLNPAVKKRKVMQRKSALECFKLSIAEEFLLNTLSRLSLDSMNWGLFKTRKGAVRRVDAWSFEEGLIVPQRYKWLEPLVMQLIHEAKSRTSNDVGTIVPLQMYLCFYPDGSYSCPLHKHDCRQITLSIGATRKMQVNSKTIEMETGDCIILHKQKHGIPKVNRPLGPRMSFNLFFTTSMELKESNVNG